MSMNDCIGYLITIRTYGSWLHGDARGSARRLRSGISTLIGDQEPKLERHMLDELKEEPFVLNLEQRRGLESRSAGICAFKEWTLHAINARSNHVHFVVSAMVPPEDVMSCLKRYLTRHLRENGMVSATKRIWSRHGSTVYLWNQSELVAACRHVVDGQGG